jgi:hypothetical protein
MTKPFWSRADLKLPRTGPEFQAYIKSRSDYYQSLEDFWCAHCTKIKGVGAFWGCGVYLPNHNTITARGEKYRCCVYPICTDCLSREHETPPFEMVERIESNIICAGVFLGGDTGTLTSF